jgi:hypothetical protein
MGAGARSLVSLAVILVAILATLLAWRLRPPPPAPPAAENRHVFPASESDVAAVTVETAHGTLRAERTDGAWQVKAFELHRQTADGDPGPAAPPSGAEVDEAMGALVHDLLEVAEIDRFAGNGRPPSEFGLDAPQARLGLRTRDGQAQTLAIGGLTLTTTAAYARIESSDDLLQVGSVILTEVDGVFYRLRGLASRPT